MKTVRSKITAQGQVSVPAEVRKVLGVGPGSMLHWCEKNGEIVVRRAGKYTSLDIHRALFPNGPPKGPPVDVKEGIEKYIRQRHARD